MPKPSKRSPKSQRQPRQPLSDQEQASFDQKFVDEMEDRKRDSAVNPIRGKDMIKHLDAEENIRLSKPKKPEIVRIVDDGESIVARGGLDGNKAAWNKNKHIWVSQTPDAQEEDPDADVEKPDDETESQDT
ncbi:hypothetical protein BDV96DRAFT_650915 [Lophiotrema nucula]|uniref:Uncharacterized protein n=1 Tax=Lophiotrema nucula TaxID=690887 RepID=A0A6A5YUQ3_9PLEO|nr:hypothetical protein BDV96DRAFT_650915 [Lophiotrema nucula]